MRKGERTRTRGRKREPREMRRSMKGTESMNDV